jgi:hypothetical protein
MLLYGCMCQSSRQASNMQLKQHLASPACSDQSLYQQHSKAAVVADPNCIHINLLHVLCSVTHICHLSCITLHANRAAKQTPSGPSPSAAAAAAAAGAGSAAARGQPQPPIGVLSPEAIREKVKTALIRLANNDAFVDSLAQELKTVGLLQ